MDWPLSTPRSSGQVEAQGTYVRTTDGGVTWNSGTVPGAAELDFRDVHAADERTAFVLSIGAGEKSRIYHTADGSKTWALRFINHDPRGFLDAIAFWDANHGIAMGDPVDGRFTILTTGDGGVNWKKSPSDHMPLAKKGEGAFAASGTCLVVEGDRNAWFGTGGAAVSRVFRSMDRGQTWTVDETPIPAGIASSVYSRWRFATRMKAWPSVGTTRARSKRIGSSRGPGMGDGPGRCRKVRGRAAIVPPLPMSQAQPNQR